MAGIAKELEKVGVCKAEIILAMGLPFSDYGREKKQHIRIDDNRRMLNLICGKAAVGGKWNLMRDMQILEQR